MLPHPACLACGGRAWVRESVVGPDLCMGCGATPEGNYHLECFGGPMDGEVLTIPWDQPVVRALGGRYRRRRVHGTEVNEVVRVLLWYPYRENYP